ncbi:MAG: cytochrome B [Bacteroidetes bacterium]|nr:MAG: cytochrome B [Bacteroidota bacterium]
MENILKHAHSGLRWVVLALLLFAVVNALLRWRSGKTFRSVDYRLNLFNMIAAHLQLLLGLLLYLFLSPKVDFGAFDMSNALSRFYVVEHPLVMVLGIVLITVGHVRAKAAAQDSKKFQYTFWYFLVALLLILSRIPWPFQPYGANWI